MSMMPSPINKKNDSSRRNRGLYVSTVALLASLALIFSYVEVIIPYNAGIPGVKLGIANIVTVTAIYKLSPWHGAAVNAIRIAVAGLLFNGLFGAVYAFAGATLSFIVMILLKKTGKFSVAGVSMAGGVFHNMGQLIIASFLVQDLRMFFYFPVLLFSGMIAGIAIGIAASMIIPRLPDINRQY